MTDLANTPRKPCLALMGEFSAGKSTLANLLIGADPLPVQVIATQLPPVWITYGDSAPFRTDLEGNQFPINLNDLGSAPLDQTAYIKIFCEEDILLQCDFIDMPGISDPNMSSEVWQRMISRADGVLWCSHATQAWRQSEAAVWASLPPELYNHSLLLLTRSDKITSARDLEKVVRRVKSETAGLFIDCLPISLLQATGNQDDYDAWAQSGAEELARQLVDLLQKLAPEPVMGAFADDDVPPARPVISAFAAPERRPMAEPEVAPMAKIVPRRVKVTSSRRG